MNSISQPRPTLQPGNPITARAYIPHSIANSKLDVTNRQVSKHTATESLKTDGQAGLNCLTQTDE